MPSNSDHLTTQIGTDAGQINPVHSSELTNMSAIGLALFTLPMSLIVGITLRRRYVRWRFKQRVAQLERSWQLTTLRRKD
jgi:hypothetical protein